MKTQAGEREWIRRECAELSGLYEGQLNTWERATFLKAIEAGVAEREYSGPAGLLGVATVRVVP